MIALVATLALTAVLGYWIAVARRGDGEAEQKLRRICMNDAAQAERLIDYELRKAPNISRHRAAQRAIERRRRDSS